jgi:hypothetical protein
MKTFARILAVALPVLMVAGCGQKQVVWQKTIDAGGDEVATALATDGTSYYVSYMATKPGEADRAGWFVTKLDKDGQERWTRMYKDSPYAACEDIWADNQGHLFATGRAKSQGKQICLVIRYAADGGITWQKGLAVGDKTWGMGICPVSGDRIAVCGMAGTEANTDHMIALLDAKDGRTVWVKNIDLGSNDLAVRIAADAKDNLAIVGHRGDTGANSDIIVVKLKPNGDTLWTRTYDSGGDDQPGDIAFDPFGNILVTGTATVGDSVRCVILEYDADGGSIRKAAYGQQAQATGNGIFVTKGADIFITGSLIGRKLGKSGQAALSDRDLRGQPTSEIIAFQYKPSAVSVWERQYSPGPNAGGVDLVVNGDVFVVATVKDKTNDVLVCRFSLPVAPGKPAGK